MNIEYLKSEIFTHSPTLERWYDSTFSIEKNNAFDAFVQALHADGQSVPEIIVRCKKFIVLID